MLITVAVTLFLLAAILPGLRHPFYLLHIALVAGAAWLIQSHIENPPGVFSVEALRGLLILHLPLINLLTFIAYGWDKSAARDNRWRIPERTLHGLALVGGTIGAIVGQKTFRHKTKKASFRLWFWLIFMAQLFALFVLAAVAHTPQP